MHWSILFNCCSPWLSRLLLGDFRPAIQKLGNSEDASVYYAACFWTDAWWSLVNRWGFHERDLCITGSVATTGYVVINLNELDHFLKPRRSAYPAYPMPMQIVDWIFFTGRGGNFWTTGCSFHNFSTCTHSLWIFFLQDGQVCNVEPRSFHCFWLSFLTVWYCLVDDSPKWARTFRVNDKCNE